MAPEVEFDGDSSPRRPAYGFAASVAEDESAGLAGKLVSWGLAKNRAGANTLLLIIAIVSFCVMLYLAYGLLRPHQGTGRPIPPAITYAD